MKMKMSRKISSTRQAWPIKGRFAISRGSRTEAVVIVCEIIDQDSAGNQAIGRGECLPYPHYGESVDGVLDQLTDITSVLSTEFTRHDLQSLLPAGSARNAVDCALWDLEAKQTATSVASQICKTTPIPLETAYTISIDTPDAMADACQKAARPLLKVKVGGKNDADRIRVIANAVPESRIILDANEGWREDNITENLEAAARSGIALIEQPLPAGQDEMLRNLPHYVPICADESAHVAADLVSLVGLYDVINIKLDKTGGLTEAIKMRDTALDLGFGLMIGCMVSTSLSMAPAVLLAQGAEFVDLDGPLLLEKDCPNGLVYEGSLVFPPTPELWG